MGTMIIVQSTEMSATTYLEEDWDTDEPIVPPLIEMSEGTGTVDTTTPLSGDFIGPLPCSATSADPTISHDVSYSNDNGSEVTSSGEVGDSRGEHDSRGNRIACIICLEEKPAADLRKHKSCGAAICLECLPVNSICSKSKRIILEFNIRIQNI